MTTNETTRSPRMRVWLDVAFSERDQAKAHGARSGPTAKRWRDQRPATADLQRWTAPPDVPDLPPGEGRLFGSRPFVEMIPRTWWCANVRTCVSPWDCERLRRLICLCSPSHLSTHLGHANVTGRTDGALIHLRRVTGRNEQQVSRHVDGAGRLRTGRSARTWHLNLRMLKESGVTLQRPEALAQHSRTAARALDRARATDLPAAVRQSWWRP